MTRPYLSAERVTELAAGMTDRDRAILATLRRVRVASGAQLERLHFTNGAGRHRRRVLTSLARRQIVARLPRSVGGVRAGSDGYVYALGPAGQRLTDGTGPAGGCRPRRPWTPGVLFLRHSLAVTEVYVALKEAEAAGLLEVVEFTTEPRTWRRFTGRGGARQVLKPDAYAAVGLGDFLDRWLIEVDRGTESPTTVERKLRLYRTYWQTGYEQARHGGVFPRIVWLVPDTQRAAVVERAIGRLPLDARGLFAVAVFDQALERILAGADR